MLVCKIGMYEVVFEVSVAGQATRGVINTPNVHLAMRNCTIEVSLIPRLALPLWCL
jgi:hypothetical protein